MRLHSLYTFAGSLSGKNIGKTYEIRGLYEDGYLRILIKNFETYRGEYTYDCVCQKKK